MLIKEVLALYACIYSIQRIHQNLLHSTTGIAKLVCLNRARKGVYNDVEIVNISDDLVRLRWS